MGYFLYDPAIQTVLERQGENMAFIPASTTKVITTVAALRILGPSYRFKTTLAITGKVKDNVLYGNVILKGEGDPLLSMSDLMAFAKTLAQYSVREVKGRFYYDETEIIPRELRSREIPPRHSIQVWEPFRLTLIKSF